jgi:hypothetical protein
MRPKSNHAPLAIVALVSLAPNSWAIDLLPKKGEEKSGEEQTTEKLASPETRYWLMSGGEAVGFNVDVEVNGSKVTSIKRPEQALEITDHVHPGLNTVKFTSKDTKRKNQPSTGTLTLTLGPEGKREDQGVLRRTYIELKDMVVHFPRPAAYRAEESAVDMKFSIKEEPNPELTQRYILYAQGEFSGHLVHVAVNGVPFLDVVGSGTHLDLNPYLVTGKNEITFSASRIEGVPFTSSEREKMAGKNFEVGVAIAGEYDPATYDQPVTQVSTVVLRYEQPADREEPEEKETLTLMAE